MILFICFNFPGRVLAFPLIPYNIRFVQRGFIERASFDELIHALDADLLYMSMHAVPPNAFYIFRPSYPP
jgi:hypothetical protein